VSIPADKVLSQLATGSVKITFGELRAALPGLFLNSGSENDARQIVLPLKEIISRINPALLSRRDVKKVEVDDDITGPFGNDKQSVDSTSLQVSAKAATTPEQKAAEPAPIPAAPTSATPPPIFVRKTNATVLQPAPVASSHVAPTAYSFNSAPQIPADKFILAPLSALVEPWPDAIKMELVQTGLMDAQAALPVALIEPGLKSGRVTMSWKNLRMMIVPKPGPVSVHDHVEIELPLKVLAPLFFASRKAAGLAKQQAAVTEEIPDLFYVSKPPEAKPQDNLPIAPVPPKIETAAAVAPVTPAASEQKVISAPLGALSEKWPDALQHEIAGWNLANAQVALPLDKVAPAMKRGRVVFAWHELRSWIQPAPPAAESVHDNIELELPLQIIAPLFLAQQAPPARPQSQLAIDSSIPNSFFGFPSAAMEAPVAAPAAEFAHEPTRPALKPVDAKLADTDYYVWGDNTDKPRIDASEYKRPQTPATDFTSRYATPKQIVDRTMKLPGMAGAIVALTDGLMIASQVPPDLNADTVAAFLPQIFDRVTQCTREMRMGALNYLQFTAGNVPWHIFHVNDLYFAAFGYAGESLPSAQLASLAGELDRRK
jgi:predicted regulator of Ras-like GTPase activity (Roadblock/LC7/MglB family)